ncbi:MAG: sigma-70 family RNA polymerase sigma factor [Oscillospiraceae bacterium]|jgi:RNA polymerase sigma-70 factor (ECF subfamily)|nr:sigma-70 family RNA polymerase sigma factor [Oscillospiraceae bacterium]
MDKRAFERLVREHEKTLYNLALRMTGNEHDAADMTQETFLRAWRAIDRFRGESAVSTWLYKLCANVCMDFLRARRRRAAYETEPPNRDDAAGYAAEVPDMTYSPETELERALLREGLQNALNKLPREQRRALLLREIGGLPYADIAAALGIPEGTVKSRIARAREQMRVLLTESGNFPGG